MSDNPSPSSRRAWVEITPVPTQNPAYGNVALLAEGVGRNMMQPLVSMVSAAVALLAEGVGRNRAEGRELEEDGVALLAEGVGRNEITAEDVKAALESPSSRRAWVEIRLSGGPADRCPVALLAEGVGRNYICWRPVRLDAPVALLAEGVGRNRLKPLKW